MILDVLLFSNVLYFCIRKEKNQYFERQTDK